MSTFNFTVRAMDDKQAFADRQFSISVKNDKMVNFCVSDGSSIYTTTNLGSDPLVKRPDVTTTQLYTNMNTLTYGNGIWIASNNSNYYTSSDGINWTPQPYPTIDGLSTTARMNITFKNGYFFLNISNNKRSSGYDDYQYFMLNSIDGINWNIMGGGPFFQSSSINYSLIYSNDFYFDGTDIFFSNAAVGTITYTSNGAWATQSVKTTSGASFSGYSITKINGLWFYYNDTGVVTSNDFKTWTHRDGFSNLINVPLFYVNGHVATGLSQNGANSPIISSLDAITWVSTPRPRPVGGSTQMCIYNGNLITWDYISNSQIITVSSTPDAQTFSVLDQTGGFPKFFAKGIASMG